MEAQRVIIIGSDTLITSIIQPLAADKRGSFMLVDDVEFVVKYLRLVTVVIP